jgi:hypothetical protein
MVKAGVSKGEKAGIHFGPVAIRMSGSFDIQTADGAVPRSRRQILQDNTANDGYSYSLNTIALQKGERE